MNRPWLTKRLGVALVAACMALAAACSSGDTGKTNKKSAESTLIVAMPSAPNGLDPERYEGLVSMSVLPNIASPLLRYKKPAPDATSLPRADQVEGELAESWSVSEDKKSITFTLRDDVKSPFGNVLSAEDVRWSVERMMKSEGAGIARFLAAESGWNLENPIGIIDDKTVRLNVAQMNEATLPVAALYFFGIYDSTEAKKHATEDDPFAYKWLANNTATFGAYTLSSLEPGKKLELTANKNYFRGASQFTDVIVQAVADSSSRLQLIQSGEVSAVTDLTFDQIASAEEDDRVQLARSVYTNIDMLGTFTKVKPFDDNRVRRAISLGIDREQIVESAYKGFGDAADDFFHVGFGVERKPSNPLTYDPEKAKALLTEAGHPNGFSMELAYNVANVGAQSEQTAVLLRSQLAKIGIDLKINPIASGADFDQAKREGKLQSWLGTSFSMMSVLPAHLRTMYGAKGISNQQQFVSSELDGLLDKIMTMPYGQTRDDALMQVSDFLFAEMPLIPLIDSVKYFALKPTIKGFVSAPVANLTYFDLSTAD